MNSSGMKRGLAATAISALAVTGLPFLATSASATPLADQIDADAVLTPNDIVFYSQDGVDVSDKNDGTNTTISLVVGGGSNVTSVQFQYEDSANPGVWVDVPGGIVARNADGVFAFDWAGAPATVVDIQAVANTGDIVTTGAAKLAAAAANTVELDTEGALGVFQAPYATETRTGDYVGVTGTVSEGSAAPSVEDISSTGATAAATLEDTDSTVSDGFNAVLDIEGYPYSAGAEANQIALNAATTNTDDAEGSTLYVQTIGSIEVTPATQEDVTPADATVDITVLDTTGAPVAGAQVFSGGDSDTDGGGSDTDVDGAETLVGYTDGRGQILNVTVGGAGTETFYVNTTDDNTYQPAVDKADTATVTTYDPVLTEVDIVNERNRSNFDIDELADNDDFTIVTEDQRGNGLDENLAGNDIEYRWIIDPSGAGDTFTSAWMGGETDANGEFKVPALTDTSYNGGPVPEGTYTLEARRPNVGGTGLLNATPETFSASESDIAYEEGAQANAPIEGETSITGTLSNDGGALAGREITVTYTPGIDSRIAPEAEQPAGVDVVGNTATVVTDANGQFTIKLEDPAGPVVIDDVPESGTFNALATGEELGDATGLQGDLGPNDPAAANAADNAEQEITVNWQAAPEVEAIEIDTDVLDAYAYGGGAAPGSPVDMDITVLTADGPDLGTAPDEAQDFPVEVSVDKGFLSPNAETESDLSLADGHDAEGDMWGFFEQLGADEEVSTGDDAEAGVVAAMERDADFDDDGLSEMTVTVTAGDVTETVEITFDARSFLTLANPSLERTDGGTGNAQVGEELEFDLFVEDQFGNLVGDHLTRISDDSTVADFRTDEAFDQTLTDFTTSGPGIVAFSDAPAVQTLMGMMDSQTVTVTDTGAGDVDGTTATVSSDPINWVEGESKVSPDLELTGKNNGGKADRLMANAKGVAAGAEVSLFKKTANGWKKIREGVLNAKGNKKFKVADKNGKKFTTYKAVVKPTVDTTKDVDKKKVR